ncbi:class E sortase [Corynebacterium sp. ES2794-CONJ1]|uniref:class E sortase n=1 Tax=unclassified Corynebacterium TaxID=2624378 RepID=UPI0021674CA9|nr:MULTISPECIES: class E sortase [unclassified Corynebacterium]MCS4490075.1 class E sortase [Corynebacterium sp. ES2775-CONJ]MCS4492574.1 class E sortase [Corynebacterium sp. ES2715-CONJ3]MCS4532224.1 class E sortase [Corynebacterium sp. ES2730-CONJ]MCU9519620.1 class E sortase [Corynebacterium sp. ES2794-CONJ1]
MTHAQRHHPRLTALGVIGELFLTVGILILLFAVYESFWTNIESAKLQAEANTELNDTWNSAAERVNPRQKLRPELGTAFAKMHIPSFGSDFSFAIIEGTDDASLLAGPGHYADTQMPGQPGNFAVAGHRVGKGAPFNDLGALRSCDAIVIETADAWNTYRVAPMAADPDQRRQEAAHCLNPEQVDRLAQGDYQDLRGRFITVPSDVSTIGARPGIIGQEATSDMEPVLTLTTCHPQFSNAERMIVHAMLADSHPKDGSYIPPILEGR